MSGAQRWFTANIGMRHVHHLCSRIPYYRLPGVSHGSKSSICPRDRYHTRSAEKPGLVERGSRGHYVIPYRIGGINRMVVEFTMLNPGKVILCAICGDGRS
jgi:hypothetical protein